MIKKFKNYSERFIPNETNNIEDTKSYEKLCNSIDEAISTFKAELFIEIGDEVYLASEKDIRFAIDNALSCNN